MNFDRTVEVKVNKRIILSLVRFHAENTQLDALLTMMGRCPSDSLRPGKRICHVSLDQLDLVRSMPFVHPVEWPKKS